MYGLIGSFTAKPGERDALVGLMAGSAGSMPGCISYVVAVDPVEADRVWVTEVWESEAHHKASLSIPEVKAAISKALPLIAGFGESTVTTPVTVFAAARQQ